jgi:mitogen-activated protein kinase organizer 1
MSTAPAEPPARALHATLGAHKGPVHVARYARGGAKYVLSGGQDRAVRLWNPTLGTEVKAYTSHGYEVLCLCV